MSGSPVAPDSAGTTDHVAVVADAWRARWPEALAQWSRFTRLHEPRLCLTGAEAAAEGLRDSFAMIRMNDQSVVIDLAQVVALGLEDHPLEILGHEIGHHVLCPANLGDQGRMVARMGWALPGKEHLAPFIGNLYADLLINDRLQRGQGLTMADVYRRLGADSPDRMWTFYLRTYEVLWRLDRGTLATGPIDARIDSDAQLGARLLRSYARRWLEGSGRFAALCYPYLEDDDGADIRRILAPLRDAEHAGGVPSGLVEIEPGEQAGAIHPALDPDLSGVSPSAPAPRPVGATSAPVEPVAPPARGGQFREPFEYGALLRSLGIDLDDHEVAIRYYRERAMDQLIPFPTVAVPASNEPVPEGLVPWSLGADLDDIDWLESLARSPVVIPGLTTLQREWGTSEGTDPGREPLDLDLYVDCSGSMPNPQVTVSYLTLAGAIVALSALRVGGRVQATLWSGPGQYDTTSGFVSDEHQVLAVLTGFIGGSTAFPIHVLRDTFAARRPTDRPAHVLVISDDGVTTMFARDERGNDGWDVAAMALTRGRGGGTLVLNLPPGWVDPDLERAAATGWAVERVQTWDQLVAFARAFSRRTFVQP